jgi:hypothetical protein
VSCSDSKVGNELRICGLVEWEIFCKKRLKGVQLQHWLLTKERHAVVESVQIRLETTGLLKYLLVKYHCHLTHMVKVDLSNLHSVEDGRLLQCFILIVGHKTVPDDEGAFVDRLQTWFKLLSFG